MLNPITQCLVKAAQADDNLDPALASIHKATYGMLLFAIPFKGLDIEDIQNMLASQDRHPRNQLLDQISPKSTFLAALVADLKNFVGDRKIICFYETRQSQRLQLVWHDCMSTMEKTAHGFDRIENPTAGEGPARSLQLLMPNRRFSTSRTILRTRSLWMLIIPVLSNLILLMNKGTEVRVLGLDNSSGMPLTLLPNVSAVTLARETLISSSIQNSQIRGKNENFLILSSNRLLFHAMVHVFETYIQPFGKHVHGYLNMLSLRIGMIRAKSNNIRAFYGSEANLDPENQQ